MLPNHRRKWARSLCAVSRVAAGGVASQAWKKALLCLRHAPIAACCGTCCGGPQVNWCSWTYGIRSNLYLSILCSFSVGSEGGAHRGAGMLLSEGILLWAGGETAGVPWLYSSMCTHTLCSHHIMLANLESLRGLRSCCCVSLLPHINLEHIR